MNLRVAIPNTFTSLNLFSGCAGVYFACNEHLVYASVCIGIAALFDFLDGMIARLLNGGSEFGKQLDSLADCVTFGVLPGIILFQLITIGFQEYIIPVENRPKLHIVMSMIGFAVPVFSALRLAKFNLDTRQTESFLGLPTPASAILIGSIPLIMRIQYDLEIYSSTFFQKRDYLMSIPEFYSAMDLFVIKLLCNPLFYILLSVFVSLLLVIELPLFSLKFKGFKWRRNKTRYIFILSSLVVVGSIKFTELYFLAIPIIIVLYVSMSLIYYLIKGKVT